MILQEKYSLSNGVEIPKLGLGTWFINNRDVVQAVKDATAIGYRHIDTAQAYRNEAGVGEGIRASGAPRAELFVTTKLAAEAKSYKKAAAAIDQSLQKLGLDYIDMMIIHSPQPWTKFRGSDPYFEGNREAWRALEEAYQAGKLRAIGLSNFEQRDIENILASCTVKPMVNQVLAHIGKTPKALIEYCQDQGILVEAYSPIAHGVLMEHDEVAQVAEKYGVTVPQLSIRYDLQLGLLPLPKTTKPAHMKNNADVDFVISAEDMDRLSQVEEITDYGDASMMPVYGGKMNLRSLFKMIVQSIRG
ncbi:MAG: aldo/keto reductase [Lewinella sp.]|nr:aldo/keto reductase [Lewinella sp.]